MTAETERLAIPIPRDSSGRLARAFIGELGGSWRVYFMGSEPGSYAREYVGPLFPLTRAGGRLARDLADHLNGGR
jgi:hypothetical protein